MLRSRRDSGNKRVNGGAAFFQLLDWNRGARRRRRNPNSSSSVPSPVPPLAVGEFNSRSPAGVPAGDDKVPLAKLLQVADENPGGFHGRKDQPSAYHSPTVRGYASSALPNAAADTKDERLRAAGLVARLMGLEFLPSMPPHTLSQKPPLHLDKELVVRGAPKSGPIKRYPDLPAPPYSSKRQSSNSVLSSKFRHQQPQLTSDSSWRTSSSTEGCATMHSSMSRLSSRRDVDGISNLSFRNCSRSVGRPVKPVSSYHDHVGGKPDAVNGPLVDHGGRFPGEHKLTGQKYVSYKDLNPSPCLAASDNANTERQRPSKYLESNGVLCNGKSNIEDKFSDRVNMKQNHSVHAAERKILAESGSSGIQPNGCGGHNCSQKFTDNLNSKICTRMSNEVENVEVKTERSNPKKKATHTRRLSNGYLVENNYSGLHKHSQIQNEAIAVKCTGQASSPVNIKCTSSVSMEQTVEESDATYAMALESNSIQICSATKDHSTIILASNKGKNDGALPRNRVTDSRAGQLRTRGSFTLTRDDLGALLVHKIKELNCMDKDKRDRSSADILEELISAMTEEESAFPCHPIDNGYIETNESAYHMHELNKLQANMISLGLASSHKGCQHHSPPSILEASFSTESSFGESISTISGRDHSGITFYHCYDELPSNDYDDDLLDSASSISSPSFNSGKISHLLEGLLIMYKPNLCILHVREPCCVSEVISNMELILASQSCEKYEKEETVMDSLILDTLENLVNACTNPSLGLAFPDSADKSLVRRFLFDCILEHLILNYNYCFLSIYKGLFKVPLILNCDKLSNEVLHKMQHWTNLAGLIGVDSCFPLQLTDIEVECCIIGLEMEQHTTEVLINEMIIDILSDWTERRNDNV